MSADEKFLLCRYAAQAPPRPAFVAHHTLLGTVDSSTWGAKQSAMVPLYPTGFESIRGLRMVVLGLTMFIATAKSSCRDLNDNQCSCKVNLGLC